MSPKTVRPFWSPPPEPAPKCHQWVPVEGRPRAERCALCGAELVRGRDGKVEQFRAACVPRWAGGEP